MFSFVSTLSDVSDEEIGILENKKLLMEEYKNINNQLEINDKTSYKVLIFFFTAIVIFVAFSINSVVDVYHMNVLNSSVYSHLNSQDEIPFILDLTLYGSFVVLIVFISMALWDLKKRSLLVNRKIEIIELLKDVPLLDDEEQEILGK